MTRNHNVTGKTISMPAGFAFGVCISLTITLILSALLAKLVSTERLEWEQTGYAIMAMLLIASMVGTKTVCVVVKRRKLLICVVEGILYWLTLFLMTALFFGGQYSGMGVTAIVIFCANAIVCILELKGERGQKAVQSAVKIRKPRIKSRIGK